MLNNPYSFSQKFQIDFPEIKNSMNKPWKNRFILNWTDLISDILTIESVKIVQRWGEIEHNEIILVHSNELHPVSPNPRWNPLKHSSKQLHYHCSWTLQEHGTPCWKTLFQHTQLFKKPYQEEFYNHTLQRKERWNEYTWKENAENWLRPVKQIAHTVTAPPTKP